MHTLLRSVLAVALISTPTLARGATCDRICLTLTLDGYFVALADRDTSRLPLAPNVRVTENGVLSAVGEGIWKQSGEATYRLDAVDPVLEAAASNAVVPENGRPVILFVRLKITDEKITEIETLVIRPGEGQRSTPAALVDPSPFHLFVPVTLQASRDEMTLAAGAYLDSLATAGTDAFRPAPITDTARRVENGVQSDAAPPASINDQLRRGFGADRLSVTDRRFAVLDEGRGIILMMGVMNLDTPARPSATPGGAPTGPPGHAVEHIGRWKQVLVEFFKVADGMIQEIQATVYDLDNPSVQGPGWPVPNQ